MPTKQNLKTQPKSPKNISQADPNPPPTPPDPSKKKRKTSPPPAKAKSPSQQPCSSSPLPDQLDADPKSNPNNNKKTKKRKFPSSMSSQPRPSPDFHPDPLDPCPDPKPNPNPITSRGVIEFSTVLINPFLTCSLCNGYFRNAQTISECMHSFCRSCLLKEFYRQTGFAVPRDGDGNNGRGLKGKGEVKCPFPDCFVGCGGDPFENNLILYDYTKQELVNKVFPNLIEDDRVAENEFWASRGVKRDDTLASDEGEPPPSHARSAVPPLVHADDELNFVMVPLYPMADSGKFEGKLEMGDPTFPMPVLVKPFLRTSGKLRVFQVKKYLVKKLNLNVKPSDLMVLCNNELMGDEHSLLYLTKTRWVGMNEDLTLKYRLAGAGD